MNYFIKRGDQEYGPYELPILQQYVSQGSISRDDLARSEAMTDWAPVSTILGTVPIPSATTFGSVASAYTVAGPLPPKLHWGWVVGIGIVTLGIFWVIWNFVVAIWVRKVVPKSQAVYYLVGYLCASVMAGVFSDSAFSALLQLTGLVLYLVAIFQTRNNIEEYYARVNPIGIGLSGVMTFFFNAAYFQYHLNNMRKILEQSPTAGAAAASGQIV